MFARPRQAIDLRSILKPHRHIARFGRLHDFLHALAVTSVGDHDAFEGPAGG
jgi:hypothetical protein